MNPYPAMDCDARVRSARRLPMALLRTMLARALVSVFVWTLVPTLAEAAGVPDARQAVIADYLASAPIENFLLQPDALPDDPSTEFFLVFDVRSVAEVEHSGLLPGAIHVPYTDLAPLLATLGDDRSQPALIYCETTLRSTQVVMALRLLGYENAWYLAGGIERWRAAGRPLVKAAPATH